ncbi:MAG: hypothetical protein EB110_07910 [Betaproteobacteria bacterium]|nr:hypothetical protein [Betaproteobacteria bacterium]
MFKSSNACKWLHRFFHISGWKWLGLCLLTSTVATHALAIHIERIDSDVFVSGDIVANDDVKLRAEFECPTAGTPRWQCTEYPRLDAFTLGLVTTTETVSLQLPDSMRPRMP